MKPLRLLAAALLTPALSLSALAASITGTVTDRTTGKPAAGDAVVLIAFGQGMQEAAHATTDAQGRYTLDVPEDSSSTHLVRVTHQKATYFQPAPPGTKSLDVDVYDVSASVKGVTTEADVLRFETDPQGLHVIENYFVKNDSKPPMTQLSNKAYEIYLPEGAQIEATAAMGPGGMPVASSPIPLPDQKGHYAFIFPVRPGETRFQVSYHVPYSGSMKFNAKVALPTENLAVMLPKQMTFTPSSSDFQPVPDNVAAQTFVIKGVSPEKPVTFTIAGSGSMPRESQDASGQGGPNSVGVAQGQGAGPGASPAPNTPEAGSAAAAADTRPGGGLGPPIDTPDPLNKYKSWILGGLALALVVGAAFLLKGKPAAREPSAAETPAPFSAAAANVLNPAATQAGPAHAQAANASLLASLKDALFTLETDRLSGRLGEEEYVQLKAALEVVLRWSLTREAAVPAGAGTLPR